jgi:cobalt-zinc-cadmium efflux system protein
LFSRRVHPTLVRVGTPATGDDAALRAQLSRHEGHDHDHGHAHGGPSEHAHEHGGHGHGLAHAHGAQSARRLGITLALTLGYFGVEVGVGFWSHSLALLADAGHMLTDAAALGLSLLTARIAARPRSASKTYGYRRAEIIGALVNASTMIVVSLFVVVEAIKRLQAPP